MSHPVDLFTADSPEAEIRALQGLIDSGLAWRLEGHVGRTAMAAIEAGDCVLGPEGHTDYWGNYVPARDEVKEGTKGSISYAEEHGTIGPFV